MTALSEQDLREIRTRAALADQGNWHTICHTDVPRLLGEIARLQTVEKAAEKLVARMRDQNDASGDTWGAMLQLSDAIEGTTPGGEKT